MTRAELAFSALDKDKSGYITTKELKKLSTKLSEEELKALLVKVILNYIVLTGEQKQNVVPSKLPL